MPYFLKLSESEKEEPIEFVSMGELANICGRSKHTIKKLIERGIMPDANFRTPKALIKRGEKKGEYILGYRLYSKHFLAPKIAKFMEGVSRGKQVTPEQKSELVSIFQSEREYFKI